MQVNAGFLRGFSWIAAFLAISIVVANVTELTIIDFIHGNPNRTQQYALFMMIFYGPIFSIVSFIGLILVFSLPHAAQAICTKILIGRHGFRGLYGFFVIIPIASIVAWYCFDYLTPSNIDYEHGITGKRYLITLAIQTAITVFTLFYIFVGAMYGENARRRLILILLVVAAFVGVALGCVIAKSQFQFL